MGTSPPYGDVVLPSAIGVVMSSPNQHIYGSHDSLRATRRENECKQDTRKYDDP